MRGQTDAIDRLTETGGANVEAYVKVGSVENYAYFDKVGCSLVGLARRANPTRYA